MHTQNHNTCFTTTNIWGHIMEVFYQEYVDEDPVKKIETSEQEGI